MHFSSGWNVDQTRILTRRELAAVLAAPAKTQNAQRNRVIVRLACCCGLRGSEIAKLAVGDVVAEGARPHLRLQKGQHEGEEGAAGAAVVGCGDAGRSEGVEGGAGGTGVQGRRNVRVLGAAEQGRAGPSAGGDKATAPLSL
jgi:integrase